MAYELTDEQARRAREEFLRALDSSVSAREPWQLKLFDESDEDAIWKEVERKLYEPKLPNASGREREWVRKLKEFSRDESLPVSVKAAAGRYAMAFDALLPRTEWIRQGHGSLQLPGFYYTRKPITPKTNKSLFETAISLKQDSENPSKKWLAQFLLDGEPEAVANFKMECLYLLRGRDGNARRLVRLVNVKGEVSKGQEVGNTDVLPNEMYASPEKFREWCSSKGNFDFGVGGGAGTLELQMLRHDVSNELAYKVVNYVESIGWHELQKKVDLKNQAEAHRNYIEKLKHGLWVYEDGAVASGLTILPDKDGILTYEGELYMLASRGREEEFKMGRPTMRFDIQMADFKDKLDCADWDESAKNLKQSGNIIGGFFREVCRRFSETVDGMEGWIAMGALLGYAGAPEVFARYKMFPGLFTPGQMGSGKNVFCGWLVGLHGFDVEKGISLMTGSAAGLLAQTENHSNIVLWVDEWLQTAVDAEAKRKIIHDAYNRTDQTKITFGGVQRKIGTAMLVSGETTVAFAATRSRYPHVLVSEHKRKAGTNHMKWFEKSVRDEITHRTLLRLIFRELLIRREEFVELLINQIDAWMEHPDLQKIPSRDRTTHSVCYAAFAAASVIFESHDASEIGAYRKFLTAHATAAAVDVKSDVNVNVFMQELITAYKAGKIPDECFRVEKHRVEDNGDPLLKEWYSYILYIEPNMAMKSLEIYLRTAGQSVTLKQKDVRDQMSKEGYWLVGPLRKRFGRKGEMSTEVAWGIVLDKHPMGRQEVSGEVLAAALKPDDQKTMNDTVGLIFLDGDPRKGPLFAIIDGVEKYEKKAADTIK